MKRSLELAEKLIHQSYLEKEEYMELLGSYQDKETVVCLGQEAARLREKYYGNKVYMRGLIEFTNFCKNNCYYCGIRRDNKNASRYRLTKEEILDCCKNGYELGFRTFVLQGGEGIVPIHEVCELVGEIKSRYPNCAVTLSLGEYSRADYQDMFDAGADRYLLRHETADKAHYEQLHPSFMSFDNRMRCLRDLKEIGYQVGCGFMVGSPYQTPDCIATDLKFIEDFDPEMCGIGPFIPQKDTPFRDMPAGTADQTIYLLSLIRLIKPNILLPATTALGTIDPLGREKGIQAGANVVMPNLSPVSERKKYALYDNKICTGDESAQCRSCLNRRMESIGYSIVTSRGDIIK